ncbi:hypothetical protein [Nostoc sp. FACHB-888]|nr:hypothetical protein [Nostoc sp. FACHB-888]
MALLARFLAIAFMLKRELIVSLCPYNNRPSTADDCSLEVMA